MNNIDIYHNKELKTCSKKVMTSILNIVEDYTGLKPYKEQIKAAKELYKGNICDMKTGEGKTLAILIALLMIVRDGHKVYIITSNDYLSERDYEYSKPIIEDLGLKSVFLKSSVGGSNETYENNNVIYATGSTLIFDYLRGIKADYDFTIIDEIDYILVECANHDFSVSNDSKQVIMPNEVFKMCKSIADNIFVAGVKTSAIKKADYLFDYNYENDYLIDYTMRTVEITSRGYNKLEKLFENIDNKLMFIETLYSTLLVKHFYVRDEQYIVENDKIIIIDSANGRKSINGSNDISIQSAIEAKEGLQITDKPLLTNTCSFPVFFSIFKTLTGISGTTSYVPYDFAIIYGKSVKKIKEHSKNLRKEIYKFFNNDEDRLRYIKKIVKKEQNPILIVTNSDKKSKEIGESLKRLKTKNINILDNFNLEQEKELLEEIKGENQVLISSRIVGRGTDIELSKKFEKGLTVILATRFFSERTERQIIGRTGRNGRKGTCYILTSLEDKIYDFGYKKKKKKKEKYIKKLQNRYESKQFEQRKHIYIRSKLFFDQDIAIKERISSFSSYQDIEKFLKRRKNNECIEALELTRKAIQYEFKFLKPHTDILLNIYNQIRPYYQQQFLSYNDLMAKTLYDNSGFNDRGKEYVNTGESIIGETIIRMLKPLIQKREKTNNE